MTYHKSINPTIPFIPIRQELPEILTSLSDGIRRVTNDRLYNVTGEEAEFNANYRRLKNTWKVREIILCPTKLVFVGHQCLAATDLTVLEIPAHPQDHCPHSHLSCPKKALTQTARYFATAVRVETWKKNVCFVIQDEAAAVLQEVRQIEEAFADVAADHLSLLAGAYAAGVHKTIRRALDAPWHRFSRHFFPTNHQ